MGSNYRNYSLNVFRFVCLFMPVFLALYGLPIITGPSAGFYLTDINGFFMLVFYWAILGIIQFLLPVQSKFDGALRLAAYHLLVASFLIFVSGIASPLAALWILLFLAANIYFSKTGLYLSILMFIITAVAGTYILTWRATNGFISQTAIYFAVILLIGLTIVAVFNVKKTNKNTGHTRKELLQQNRILTLVNSLSDAVLSVDKNGRIQIYNAASLNLLDTNVDLSGKQVDKVLSLNDREGKTVLFFEQYQHVKSTLTRDDLWHKFKDGESIRLEIICSPIYGSYDRTKQRESHEGYIIIMRDVTKAKSLEEERDEFIGVVSHELRTPVTITEGTISNAQFILDRPNVSLDVVREALNKAHEQIMFLAHMINDLSTLSRAERGVGDKPEKINLNELANKLFAGYAKEAEAKGLDFNLDVDTKPGSVFVSRLYLEEILHNFITNAIRYTKKGSVTLTIKRVADIVTFAVKDTGIGISRTEQPKVFEKFWRSEDYRTRETSGTGLGLYVASKLAKKLNTSIELTSRLNYGSTFSFSLPISQNKPK